MRNLWSRSEVAEEEVETTGRLVIHVKMGIHSEPLQCEGNTKTSIPHMLQTPDKREHHMCKYTVLPTVHNVLLAFLDKELDDI